ncbi:MAG TPA: hypothetical protein VG965_06860 [Patescibacteria group bacterium]|nr:hypothetical protein [Patescibacteria group bacterium]
MGTLGDIGQKIKGEAQDIKGDIEINTGNKVKGHIDKAKGKLNKAAADAKLKVRQEVHDEKIENTRAEEEI